MIWQNIKTFSLTQLFKIADALLKEGYTTISFDAPAHGKSPGNSTIMIEFIASIFELERQFGPFEIAIGHSLGGMAVLNAAKSGLEVQDLKKVKFNLNDFFRFFQINIVFFQRIQTSFFVGMNESRNAQKCPTKISNNSYQGVI